MKRYNLYKIDYYSGIEKKLNWGISEDDGEWCEYSEVEAELTKKDEEIARLKEEIESLMVRPNEI